MNKKLQDMLHLNLEPIGVFFGNEDVKCDIDVSPEKRNCVVPFLIGAAKGKTISMDEESCNCAGGAVGCCFGDGFARRNPQIQKLLSQGYGEDAPKNIPPHMKDGEKFFYDEETALKWRKNLPLSKKAYPRIVFAPMKKWDEIGNPDLVFIFADPDRISAFVILLGFHNGRAINTIAPFGAACHSIMYAVEQMDSEDHPMAVMGLFDISQRNDELANYLSMTMPYELWEKITKDLEKSCLVTHSWREIEKRL